MRKSDAIEQVSANNIAQTDIPLRKPVPNAPVPQPETLTLSDAFSTFAMNVSDVSFKFAEASLENGQLPDSASIRSEEFINAFDYRDPRQHRDNHRLMSDERAIRSPTTANCCASARGRGGNARRATH